MNKLENQMLDILKQGREEYGYVGVKAEFEAEGTRTDELLRLIELARRADLKMGLKIGGCEAVRDLIESKQFGVDYIIAPMIETPYALSKFIDAKNKVYGSVEQENTEFLFNLETITAYENRELLFSKSTVTDGVDGVVFGRVDFAMSKQIGRNDIVIEEVTNAALDISSLCARSSLDLVVGGGVSIESLSILKRISDIHLSRFETRKIIFSADCLNQSYDVMRSGLLSAVHFELLWLQNKREHYRMIEIEDEKRIEMLDSRWNVLGNT
jgi:hypothetical protein